MERFLFDFTEQPEDYVGGEGTDPGRWLPPAALDKEPAGLPRISEGSLARHFTNLSENNFGVDNGFYPLGSCTMKYNPKANEKACRLPSFLESHPLADHETVQGCLELLFRMERFLKDISGMDAVTFQPAAGAHGEITGIMLIRAYLDSKGESGRRNIIVPDSSHGTNPASASLAGFNVIEIKSGPDGLVDLDKLKSVLDGRTACLMLTNPNTLGLFEKDILAISALAHGSGALLYYDGANLNPLLGRVRAADMGFDVVHFNLHKSFSTPHGGGGPGSGPVGVNAKLAPFLPRPRVKKEKGRYVLSDREGRSIGRVHSFYGNFGVIVRAFFYILELGVEGLRAVSEKSILNANYLKERLKGLLELPFAQSCLHEFVLSGKPLAAYGLHTVDLAKRLMDYGHYPPTVYFPLIVPEAVMIEPAETESRETLDRFSADFGRIMAEAKNDPGILKQAPHSTPVKRLDEVAAARNPVLTYDQYLHAKK